MRVVRVRFIEIYGPRPRRKAIDVEPAEIRDSVRNVAASEALLALEAGGLDEGPAVLLGGRDDDEIGWEGLHIADQDVVSDLNVSPWYLLRLSILTLDLHRLL